MGRSNYEKDCEMIENQIRAGVYKKFTEAGIVLFPEITLEKAVEILDYPREVILEALHTWKLPGRRVLKEHKIRVDDLYYWAVAVEIKKKKEEE